MAFTPRLDDRGTRANRIRLAKEEAFHFNGFFSDKVQQVISVYFDE